MMAEKKQRKKKTNNYKSAKNTTASSPHKKALRTSKALPAELSTSESSGPKEQGKRTDGLTELFKCVDEQLRKDAAQIAKRVTKQIEKGFTVKQMVDWMKRAKNKPMAINGFEELISKLEQEAKRNSAN